jgi:hypothetical protein
MTELNLQKTCIEVLYELHSSETDEEYELISDDIIGDMLMNKIKNGKLIDITYSVDRLIKDFYDYAEKMYQKYHFETGCSNYIVYRGTNTNYVKEGIAVQPIPFSVSIDQKNAYNWVRDNCCMWHIHVPLDTRFLGINNPKEGREVILPAGILVLTSEFLDENGITNYIADFKPCNTYSEMIKLQKDYGLV